LLVLVCAPALRNSAAATNWFLSFGTLQGFRFMLCSPFNMCLL